MKRWNNGLLIFYGLVAAMIFIIWLFYMDRLVTKPSVCIGPDMKDVIQQCMQLDQTLQNLTENCFNNNQ